MLLSTYCGTGCTNGGVIYSCHSSNLRGAVIVGSQTLAGVKGYRPFVFVATRYFCKTCSILHGIIVSLHQMHELNAVLGSHALYEGTSGILL